MRRQEARSSSEGKETEAKISFNRSLGSSYKTRDPLSLLMSSSLPHVLAHEELVQHRRERSLERRERETL